MKTVHPNTPGFFLDYKYKVVDGLGRDLKQREIQEVMSCYINDESVGQCISKLRRSDLL